MISLLKRIFKKQVKEPIQELVQEPEIEYLLKVPKGETNPLLLYFAKEGRCPDCNGNNFLAGPSGGLSQNIKCNSCKSKFNVAIYEGCILQFDRI